MLQIGYNSLAPDYRIIQSVLQQSKRYATQMNINKTDKIQKDMRLR